MLHVGSCVGFCSLTSGRSSSAAIATAPSPCTMPKKCPVIRDDGTPCGKISRGAAGLCHKHGAGRCRIEGCGKPARRAGRLCLDHCGERGVDGVGANGGAAAAHRQPRGAEGQGGAQTQLQKSSGFVGKRAAAKVRRKALTTAKSSKATSKAAITLVSIIM